MVTYSRTSTCVNRLRPINSPKPLKVQEDGNGNPIAIIHNKKRILVEGIKDCWRIDDEWWREEISRLYFQIILRDGRLLTIFRDLTNNTWFVQPVSTPASKQHRLDIFVKRGINNEAGEYGSEQSNNAIAYL